MILTLDALKIEWELLPEPTEFGAYAGQGEVKPEGVEDFIQQAENGTILFRVPKEGEKSYRLFVYIYDGQGNMAVANIPFSCGGELIYQTAVLFRNQFFAVTSEPAWSRQSGITQVSRLFPAI